MSQAASPGQVSYEAYWPALGSPPPVPWDGLSPVVHRAWEAAAEAAITAWIASPDWPTPTVPQEEERRDA